MRYGLRLGPWPHVVISTTPKPRKLIKELFKRDDCVITTASTKDNPHLHKDVRKALYEDYEGTRMGRQELHAELLEDVENALWTYENIEKFRIPIAWCPEEFDRVVVGVDPAVSSVNDEHGIIVCGMLGPFAYDRAEPRNTDMSHAFVLDDQTMMGKPEDWARVVRNAFNDWQANLIVAEINNGYELVLRNIHALDDTLPVKDEWASRGKAKRAEPVANFYQQGRIHHVGAFEELEDQMTSFDPFEPDDTWSPDRMDAMVWGMTNLMVRKNTMRSSNYEDMRQRGRR
jgi:phage terminase large subunit-like protein